jgi:serine/threonine-protein phosphatase 6 regulatory ankyrin repeat subunit B
VEIVAVSVTPSRGRPFWTPDGSRLVDRPYDTRSPAIVSPARGQRGYEVVARVSGVAKSEMRLKIESLNGERVMGTAAPYRGNKALDDLRVFECVLPGGSEELEFGLDIAANQWTTVRSFKGPGVYGDGPNRVEVVVPDRAFMRTAKTLFIVRFAPTEHAARLVAIDRKGVSHVSTGAWLMGREYHSLEAEFPDVAAADVREYRLQECVYERKWLHKIHLAPAEDLSKAIGRYRAARLLAQEKKFDPARDEARIDEAMEKIARLSLRGQADAWAGAVRDLAEIGPPAVPAIVAELQHTRLPYARSALAVALRAIDDPRAVPGLCAALANCPLANMTYGGLRADDESVHRFMIDVSLHPAVGYGGQGSTFALDRPVEEIWATLEALTGQEADAPKPRPADRSAYEGAATSWLAVWQRAQLGGGDGLPPLRVARGHGEAYAWPTLPDAAQLPDSLKADPKAGERPFYDKWTMLHAAIALARLDVVNALLSAGTDPNVAGEGGWTPLHLAAALGQGETVALLLAHGANVRAKADDGCTPLLASVGLCRAPTYGPLPAPSGAIVRQLLEKGADVRESDRRGRTVLHGIATAGDADLARLVLERGVKATAADARGRVALHRSVECGNDAVTDVLLAAGADVNAKDADGRMPINFASYGLSYTAYNPLVVKKLIDRGAEVDLPTLIALGTAEQVAAAVRRDPGLVNKKSDNDDNEEVPLQWAMHRKSPEMVKLLLDAGGDPNLKDRSGNPPLHYAGMSGDVKMMALLLAAKANPNTKGQGGCTALYWACWQLHDQAVQYLLDHGADPRLESDSSSNAVMALLSSLRDARPGKDLKPEERRAHQKRILVALLDHGADPNQRSWGPGYTPIYAAEGELAELLLARGAKLDVTDDKGNTPLHYAALSERLELARFLFKHHVALEARNKADETPLHSACGSLSPKADFLKHLLDQKPNLNALDSQGRTPLLRAAERGSVVAATLLLERGADVSARDKEGATALHYAAKISRNDLISLLLKHGGEVNAKDAAGRTPLQWTTGAETRALLLENGAAEP